MTLLQAGQTNAWKCGGLRAGLRFSHHTPRAWTRWESSRWLQSRWASQASAKPRPSSGSKASNTQQLGVLSAATGSYDPREDLPLILRSSLSSLISEEKEKERPKERDRDRGRDRDRAAALACSVEAAVSQCLSPQGSRQKALQIQVQKEKVMFNESLNPLMQTA